MVFGPADYQGDKVGVTAAARNRAGLDIIVHALPPAHDAIGEYTYLLSQELAKTTSIRILCPLQEHVAVPKMVDGMACVSDLQEVRFARLTRALLETPSKAVLLQYNPFAWGNRGWTRDLIAAIRQFRNKRRDVILGVMFHETYTMHNGWRPFIMRQYQRCQCRQLVRLADVSFFSTEKWAAEYQTWGPKGRVLHAPVGSNLPLHNASRNVTRTELGIDSATFVCGVFGGAHPSRMLPYIKSAAEFISNESGSNHHTMLLHVGREPLDWSGLRVPVMQLGALAAQPAANALASADVLINPFVDGISTRRGSAIAALQQGVPLISTRGPVTDTLWHTAEDSGVFLGPNHNEAAFLGVVKRFLDLRSSTKISAWKKQQLQLFDAYFSWPSVASRISQGLGIPASSFAQPHDI